MIYALTKAAHLVALFVWIGGVVAAALSLRYPALPFLEQIKSYDRAVTSPAMVAAWLFGILLAIQGGWFAQSWLGIKILLVLILSGLHGVLAGKLRRATSGSTDPEASGRLIMPLGLLLVAVIFWLSCLTLELSYLLTPMPMFLRLCRILKWPSEQPLVVSLLRYLIHDYRHYQDFDRFS